MNSERLCKYRADTCNIACRVQRWSIASSFLSSGDHAKADQPLTLHIDHITSQSSFHDVAPLEGRLIISL